MPGPISIPVKCFITGPDGAFYAGGSAVYRLDEAGTGAIGLNKTANVLFISPRDEMIVAVNYVNIQHSGGTWESLNYG